MSCMTKVVIKNGTPVGSDSLCKTCRWAHRQKGFRESEEAIFCRYAWELRRVVFPVRECTDYSDSTLPTRDEMEDIAWVLDVRPSGKIAGFLKPKHDDNKN